MKILDWKGYNWITQERWGQIHPEKSISWYDDTAVEIDDNGFLILKTQSNPKYFEKLNTTSPIGSGLVSCQNRFGYGYFSIEAILPKGPSLWPAFWMWAWESWPPEIDVVEAYSNKRGSYFNWGKPHELFIGKFWRTKTNFYLKDNNDKHYNLGDKSHYWTWKNPSKHIMEYSVLWLPDKIEIHYNGKTVRKITDPKILKQFQNIKMNVIINNFVMDNISLKNFKPSEFIITDFQYIPMEDLTSLKR